MASPAESLRAGLAQLPGPALDAAQVAQLLAYLDLLARWNRTYNLTAVRDPAEMVTRHILDSLAVLPWLPGGRLLDAGSGAGLPGIPLAIARPELQVTLLDSAGKKVRFLRHVCRELPLGNVEPLQERLETYPAEAPFDAIVSRAFASLAAFASAARHLAGAAPLLAMKGRYPEDELAALPDWVRLESVEALTVPGLQEQRHLVIMAVSP
ncbi:MAG: 16S rRNA (guanine(527)-N(7))-methyltransferase RsmG [Lysobacterales bacterium]